MAENGRILVRFWEDAWLNQAESDKAGRKVFNTVDWCEKKVAGEKDSVSGPVHKMQPDPREQFPQAWAAYQKDKSSEGIVGTPLKEVPWLSRGEIETLKHSGVRTLENLAGLNDANVTGIPGGLQLRAKAKAQIAAAKESVPLQRMSEELAARDSRIADLEKQIADLVADKRRTKKE